MDLYNMDTNEWKLAAPEKGGTWRSTASYRCEICHVETNLWVLGGWLSIGPRILCPGDAYNEHDEIESTLKELKIVSKKINDYGSLLDIIDDSKGNILIEGLNIEKKFLEARTEKLRKLFSSLHDVHGNTDSIKDYTPFSRYASVKKNLEVRL